MTSNLSDSDTVYTEDEAGLMEDEQYMDEEDGDAELGDDQAEFMVLSDVPTTKKDTDKTEPIKEPEHQDEQLFTLRQSAPEHENRVARPDPNGLGKQASSDKGSIKRG